MDENKKERIKRHFIDNKKFYIGIGIGAGVAGISLLLMRSAASSGISHSIGELSESPTIQNVVTGKNNVLNSVSYISANRQGPPSWVIRCIETGEVFTSQNAAAKAMGFPFAYISNHLNGSRDHVNGYTFERLCMAV